MKRHLWFLPSHHADSVQVHHVDDETMVLETPPDEFGDALLVETSAEILLSVNSAPGKIIRGQPGAMLLNTTALFCTLTPQEAAAWTTGRGLHPWEEAALRERGLSGPLPEVVSTDLAQPILAAVTMKAKASSAAVLTLTRGRVRLVTIFENAA